MNPKKFTRSVLLFSIGSLFFYGFAALADAGVDIEIVRTPDDGIQPRAVVDNQGTIHLIYYKKASENGDLFYITRQPDKPSWTRPIRVNTTAKSVVPNGSIGMAQLALGKQGRVHVTWFDMHAAKFWYTRLNDDKTDFEAQRNLVTRFNKGIEASGALAADGKGNVYMVWHAGLSSEAKRRVYVTHSKDDGKSFSPERRASPGDTGACGCCGLSAITDREGTLYVSYRAAGQNVHRDMTLLESSDSGQSFTEQTIHRWKLNACPVTTTTFAQQPNSGVIVAWETEGRSYLADIDKLSIASSVGPAPPTGRQKNPSVAVNSDGITLITWGLGRGYASGGRLHWQVFGADGKPTNQKGKVEGDMPLLSVAAAVSSPDGRFVIIH